MADDPDTDTVRYWAFISYSHRDEAWASWLHKRLETYTVHKKLVGTASRHGEPVPRRLFPIFRDRDELEGASDLPDRINQALRQSRFLIVVCSPRSAQSVWVDQEIRTFKALGGDDRVLALIVDGEPNAQPGPNGAVTECFPVALRRAVGSDRQLLADVEEPMAADVRKGKDGKRNALLKILAGVLGVRFDELKQRDRERRRRRLMAASAAAGAVVTVLTGLAVYGGLQQALAARRALEATSRSLVYAATTVASSKLDLALLLALEAHAVSPTVESRQMLWDMIELQPRLTRFLAPGQGPNATALAVDATGRYTVAADSVGELIVWDLTTGGVDRGPWQSGEEEIARVAFAGGRRDQVFALDVDDTLIRWDGADDRKAFDLAPNGELMSATFSQTRPLLATIDDSGSAAVWNLSAWPPTHTALGSVKGDAFFVRQDMQVAVLGGGALTTFDLETRARVGHVPLINQSLGFSLVDISPDGRTIAAINADSTLEFWTAETGRVQRLPLQLPDLASTMTFSPDGEWLAIGFAKGDIRLVNVKGRAFVVPPLRPGDRTVSALAFDPTSARLVTGSSGGAIAQWQAGYGTAEGLLRSGMACDEGTVMSLALPGSGDRLVAACVGGSIAEGSLRANAQAKRLLATGREGLASLALGVDETTALLVSDQDHVGVADLSAGTVEWQKPESERPGDYFVEAVASGDARVLAAVSKQGRLLLRDVEGRTSRTVNIRASDAHWLGLALDRTGKTVGLVSNDGMVFVGQIGTGDISLTQLPGFVNPERPIRFRDAENQIVAINNKGRVVAWDLAAPESQPRQLVPGIATLAVPSDDGSLLVTHGGATIHLFDVASGKELARRELDAVADAVFSRDGKTLVLGVNMSALVWALGDTELRKAACALANRELTAEEVEEHLGGASRVTRCSVPTAPTTDPGGAER